MLKPYDYTIPKNPFFRTKPNPTPNPNPNPNQNTNPNPNQNTNPNPNPNPNWNTNPNEDQGTNPNIQQYKNTTLKEAKETFSNRTQPRSNLTTAEKTTLNKLKNRKDIIIKKADKGDTIVVETVERYTQDGLKHLNDKKVYTPTTEDINPQICQAINKLLQDALDKGLLDKETHDNIKPPENARTPIIYFLKKLHKNPISVRPIVSNVNSPTSNLSNFMDILLKPIVKTFPQILLNTTQLLLEIETLNIPNDSFLASLDVSALYTNIPTEESIDIIIKYLEDYKQPHHPPIQLLKEILNFILKYNCFSFCNLFYLQTQGVAMGTKMAPNFANIFMADFENKHILNRTNPPYFYRRYIDDIFIIWTDSPENFQQMVNEINECHPTIKMTSEISQESINYLDLTIYIKENHLETTTFFKTTNTFSYLPGKSHHPKSTKNGIFKGETIRMLRNNSNPQTYQQQTTLIKEKFQDRNYPDTITNQDIPDFNSRHDYLQAKEKGPANRATLTTNFDPTIPTNNILNQHWPILFSEQSLRQKLPNKPRICYRAPRNLGKILTRAKTDTTLPIPEEVTTPTVQVPRNFPAKTISCRTTNCATCPMLTNKSHFICYQTKQCYELKNIYSCDINNAIYLLECSICQKQYVGETGTTIRVRMRHHRNMYQSQTNRPIYTHPKKHQSDFSIFKLTIIDQVTDRNHRKTKETLWIQELRTKLPFGLNVIQKNNH